MNKKDIIKDLEKNIITFIKDNPKGIIIIWGATATGKTGISLLIAEKFPIEIISCDSRQIFRYMDIGTDKVSKQDQKKITHHMIDIINPDKMFTAGEWKKKVENLIPEIQKRGNIPIITGGTGLYIDTIYRNFSMPEVRPDYKFRNNLYNQEKKEPGIMYKKLYKIDNQEAQKLHPNSLRYIARALEIYEKTGKTKTELCQEYPPKQPILMVGLRREKDDTNRKINARIKEMINEGLIQEVQNLLNQGYSPESQAMQGIGYKEIIGYIKGEYDLDKAIELLKRNTHHYAKRQRTWFRKYILDSKTNPKQNVKYILYNLSE